MKKSILIAAFIIGVGSLAGLANVQADSSGQKGFIVGHVIEISTYGMKGGIEGLEKAMENRAEQGFPVGIIEEDTGKLWVCVYRNSAPASGLETANAALKDYIAQKVIAQGLKFEHNGVNVIRFSNISEY